MRTPPRSERETEIQEALQRTSATSRERTITFTDLSPWRQDNPAILTGYRRETRSWLGCWKSIWWLHNETVNIWSHVFGASVTLLVAFSLSSFYGAPKDNIQLDRQGILAPIIPVYPFPSSSRPTVGWDDAAVFSVFLFGCFVCFMCSSTFHTSLCHSKQVVDFMNRIDYLGILVLGTVNFFPTFHYAFFCDPWLRNIYISLMIISGSTGVYLVCAPTYATPAYRRMRTYTFFTLGFVAIFPFAHAIWRYGYDEASKSLSLGWLAMETLAYIGGALMYADRCPERLLPGQFDIFGSSHQIFHVCSLFAALFHYAAIGEGFRYWHGERGGVCLFR